jgi:prepilin-type N-terminal cleavage/methylation domain-containing protein
MATRASADTGRVRLVNPAALRAERGFTLVEVLVVVIVIAILSMLALSMYIGYRERGHDAAARENIHRVFPSIQAYFVDHESYAGMTIPGLAAYDAALDPALYSLGGVAPTDNHFCVESSSSGRTWRKNGPDAALEQQDCP